MTKNDHGYYIARIEDLKADIAELRQELTLHRNDRAELLDYLLYDDDAVAKKVDTAIAFLREQGAAK